MPNLVEVDSLEALIIIDNELDLMSRPAPDTVSLSNTSFGQIALGTKFKAHDRGVAKKELRMEAICCAAHGYSVLITASKDGVKHSVLFDAGPEGDIWERNVKRLAPDLATVELVQLSHWHRDHSGGMAKAVEMISAARKEKGLESPVVVDLHPSRPDFRGMIIEEEVISLEADPSFSELEAAGGKISKNEEAHTVLDDFFLISGMIPRTTSYELGVRNGVRFDTATKTWTPDEEIRDERFLMVNLKGKGLITFTGCSHAGAINVSKHSLTLGSPAPLYAVVGGYHLAPGEAEQVSATVRDLVELNPRILVPGHCSGWRVKFEIEKYLPGRLVPCSVGLNYVF